MVGGPDEAAHGGLRVDEARVVHDLHRGDLHPRRDAGDADAVDRAGDRAGDVRAVRGRGGVPGGLGRVHDATEAGRALVRRDLGDQVRMGAGDAAVEDADDDVGACRSSRRAPRRLSIWVMSHCRANSGSPDGSPVAATVGDVDGLRPRPRQHRAEAGGGGDRLNASAGDGGREGGVGSTRRPARRSGRSRPHRATGGGDPGGGVGGGVPAARARGTWCSSRPLSPE